MALGLLAAAILRIQGEDNPAVPGVVTVTANANTEGYEHRSMYARSMRFVSADS